MALINRVTRLFKADFHAVLDKLEEPRQLLKQAIRDMEDELQAAEQGIADCAREQEALTGRIAEVQATISETDEQLDLCFAAGNDELARGLIRRKLEAGRFLKRLDARFEANGSYLDEQRALADENRRTLDSLQQKAEVFAEAPASRAVVGDDSAWLAHEMAVAEAEIEIAFQHEKSQRSAL